MTNAGNDEFRLFEAIAAPMHAARRSGEIQSRSHYLSADI
ncbi:hypothetical protein LG3211_2737 [Lysobacter gummosus]|nr:hypothetical protein LG3211_2737 [Lysobacter gummosus]